MKANLEEDPNIIKEATMRSKRSMYFCNKLALNDKSSWLEGREIGRETASFFLQAAFSVNQYPLKNLSILDSGMTIHIFNNLARIRNIRPANPGDFVWAGITRVLILAYGQVSIEVKRSNQFNLLILYDVAYCKDFLATWFHFDNSMSRVFGGIIVQEVTVQEKRILQSQ